MKIGIIREGKNPPDARVPLTPTQCITIQQKYPQIQLVVQPSAVRCINDEAYLQAGVMMAEDVSDCDILLGIKEVPKELLIPNKTYFFFSHTIKKQAHNRALLQTILQKNIRLVDYETLTTPEGIRVIAFGRWAGIVGAHNGMMAYGNRTGAFALEQMHKYDTFANACAYYKTMRIPPMKIVVTGTGRVSSGAVEVLDAMGIRRVSPHVYLSTQFNEPVYTQLNNQSYCQRKDGKVFSTEDFYENPDQYESIFDPYTKVTDLMVNGIFWNNRAPAFFTKETMLLPDFHIKTIADITCDIAPVSSIPSTLFASTIADPVFGYDIHTGQAVAPYQPSAVDMMTIDNLPSELPKDASAAFGEQFIKSIIDELLGIKHTNMIPRATIAQDGKLTSYFAYLQDYVDGNS